MSNDTVHMLVVRNLKNREVYTARYTPSEMSELFTDAEKGVLYNGRKLEKNGCIYVDAVGLAIASGL